MNFKINNRNRKILDNLAYGSLICDFAIAFITVFSLFQNSLALINKLLAVIVVLSIAIFLFNYFETYVLKKIKNKEVGHDARRI